MARGIKTHAECLVSAGMQLSPAICSKDQLKWALETIAQCAVPEFTAEGAGLPRAARVPARRRPITRANVEDALADEDRVRYYERMTRVLVQAVHEDRVYLPQSSLDDFKWAGRLLGGAVSRAQYGLAGKLGQSST
ncbi:glycoside hydrolase family 1 protein [Athelia psychrophila]|uniref:Glycoside hydrolase family 1 protein n=1 Tax=Athelia psychrophila TaxID=1759441 RepID=A0A165Z837_9AGAM|nr:glycoside hydrolase family 1 protein [Fibularhizoctonia sp. CBS 109695]